jgi:hypothetical protein
MKQFILKERVLNDDTLFMPEEEMIFKGGYIGIIKEYSYQNDWSDSLRVRKFKSKKALLKHIEKTYPEFEFTCEVY